MAGRLEVPLRRWRNARILLLTLPLALLTVWVATRPHVAVGPWAIVFPALAAHGLYRLARPPVPVVLDDAGVTVATGLPLIGLRTTIPWHAVARLRVTGGQLLVELRDGNDWLERQPWRVRANIRASRRRSGASVALPLRELQSPPEGLLPALSRVAPVPVGDGRARRAARSRR